jgi:hypothetical protein
VAHVELSLAALVDAFELYELLVDENLVDLAHTNHVKLD